ncbi:MAG: prolyl oligopeptidase family serine peptidase [Luteimonas sp.]
MQFRFLVLILLPLAILPLQAQAERGFQARDLATLTRVSSPTLSPDGGTVVFAQREVDFDANKSSIALYARNLRTRDLAPPKRITPQGWNVNSPSFSPDGRTVYFLSGKSDTQQLYAMPATGGTPRQLTAFALDVGTYRLSPDGRRIAFSADTFAECGSSDNVFACTKKRLDETAKAKTTGVVYEQLFVRHWDTWKDGRRSRLYGATLPTDAKTKPLATATALSAALDGDIPSRPFGGSEDYAWSPDGKAVVASVRVAGRSEPWSTNFDLYRIDADGKAAPVNLTAGNPAWDAGPVFGKDANLLYYRAMKRAGFEADRYALIEMDLARNTRREIAPQWDRSPGDIALSEDGSALYVTADDLGRHPLFRVDVASGEVTEVVGDGTVSSFDLAGGTLALTRASLQTGDVLYVAEPNGNSLRAITQTASERLPDVAFGDYEQFTFKGANNATVHGYVVKPWNYREGGKYPVALLIHGGPQGSFGNGWSYHWNPQTYAGQGYAVVMIDFHGSTGYGQAFTDSISGDWGGKPLEDLKKGWAAAQQQYPFLDGDRACALGASYGGYMINWIAGNWFDRRGNSPWQCLVNHDGVFDTRSMAFETEELWFTEWENRGTPWDNPKAYEKFNPANHVGKWKVPMLVVHGEKDYRVPVSQGLSTFTALQRRGIESKLLYFPDENHWVLKPQNSVLWHDTVNAWLQQHIGP